MDNQPIYTAPKPKGLYRFLVFGAVFFGIATISLLISILVEQTYTTREFSNLVTLFLFVFPCLIALKLIKRVQLYNDGVEMLSYSGKPLRRIFYKDVISVKEKGKRSKSIARIRFVIKTERTKIRIYFNMHPTAFTTTMGQSHGMVNQDSPQDFMYKGLPITDYKTMYAFIKHELQTKAGIDF